MKDFTHTFETHVDAPVHAVFEYCRDPRHLFEGWDALTVTDVTMTPDGVGTTAHIEGRFFHGMIVEQIEREFTDVTTDAQIVSRAHASMRVLGRTKEVENGPVFTWLFDEEDEGTRLQLVVLEENLPWWQRLSESVSALTMGKELNGMLAAVKAGAEREYMQTA